MKDDDHYLNKMDGVVQDSINQIQERFKTKFHLQQEIKK